MEALKSFGQQVLQSGIVATAIALVVISFMAKAIARLAQRRGFESVSWGVEKFSYAMCAAMVATYLYSAVGSIAIALGLWK